MRKHTAVRECFPRVRSRCGAVHLYELGGQVCSRLFVAGALDWSRSGFSSRCRFRGKHSTLHFLVVFGVPRRALILKQVQRFVNLDAQNT